MEMHIIHRNKLYADIEEAQGHKNGLVVLGIFFQVITIIYNNNNIYLEKKINLIHKKIF
ncbi:hypothetical protein G9C98_008372 [Cotesia typhae]|uniref:Alpha-carbonic anhydrase domain-containing protein n=1 Tax=Cotesia typhae TaxID=2053667 RepID=A0A8J5QXK9_9HYME|nr:hypothetical protein G9C98_008372 [Cotesia typhae]